MIDWGRVVEDVLGCWIVDETGLGLGLDGIVCDIGAVMDWLIETENWSGCLGMNVEYCDLSFILCYYPSDEFDQWSVYILQDQALTVLSVPEQNVIPSRGIWAVTGLSPVEARTRRLYLNKSVNC